MKKVKLAVCFAMVMAVMTIMALPTFAVVVKKSNQAQSGNVILYVTAERESSSYAKTTGGLTFTAGMDISIDGTCEKLGSPWLTTKIGNTRTLAGMTVSTSASVPAGYMCVQCTATARYNSLIATVTA